MMPPCLESGLPERIEAIAGERPDDPAFLDGAITIAWSRLATEMVRLSCGLRNEGVRSGDVVAVAMRNSWEYAAIVCAAIRTGAAVLPCNPEWRAEELRGLAARLAICTIIADAPAASPWAEVAGVRVLSIEQAQAAGSGGAAPTSISGRRASRGPAVFLATSGSTGRPKLVGRTEANLLAGARNVWRALEGRRDWRFLSAVPFYHANGFSNGMVLPLVFGAQVVVLRQFTPAACLTAIRVHRPQVFIGSPLVYSLLADQVSHRADTESLVWCLSSGARLPAGTAERWRERAGRPVRQLYGSSETGTVSIDTSDDGSPALQDYAGKPVPGVEVRVLDDSGRPVACGVQGRIAIRSAAMMGGYYDEPEPGADLIGDGFLRTGDLGYLDADGAVHLTGRADRVLNVAGVKVDPVEIERVIENLRGVSGCHVSVMPGGRGTEVIRALVAVPGECGLTRADVVAHCRRTLAEYKIPRVIDIVPRIESTITGKMPAPVQSHTTP